MADITDIYSIEFDSAGFESQIQAAIDRIDELNSSLETSADSSADLEKATGQLSSILKTEANGLDQLNTKRNVLVKTQQNLNKESESYAAIGAEINNTNNRIATSTAKTTTRSKGLFQTFKSGARNLMLVRRSVSLLNVAFKALAGVTVFGAIMQAVPLVLSYFGRVERKTFELDRQTKSLNDATESVGKAFADETAELNNLFGALNDSNEGSKERSQIIDEIQSKYGDYIGNINLESASQDELKLAYERATAAILNQVVAQAKAARAREIVNQIIDRQVKLSNEQRELQKRAAFEREQNGEQIRRQAEALEQLNPALRDQAQNFDETVQSIAELNKAFAQSDTENLKTELEDLDKTFAEIEKKLSEQLVGLIDPTLLTGDFSKAAKTASGSASVLAGSLADLKSQLADLQKQQREQTSAKDQAGLLIQEARIKALKEQIEQAESGLVDFRNISAAKERIEKLETELIVNETARRIEQLENAAEREKKNVIGTTAQRAAQIKLIEERLTRDIKDVRDKAEEQTEKDIKANRDANLKLRQDAIDEETQLVINGEQRKLNAVLLRLETERNAELSAATNAITDAETLNKAVSDINKKFDSDRKESEKETQSEILRLQIKAVSERIKNLDKFGESTSAERVELSRLKLELEELSRTDATIDIDVQAEDARKKIAESVTEIADAVEQISSELLGSVGELLATQTEVLDESVQRSRDALNAMRQDSENFNARQLELEKQRLERLQQARERAADREKSIALTQLTVNSLVAISKAAAEGGVAAPFTIASTIIALIAGFAAARNASENAFFDGTEYVDPHNKYPAGRDTVPARLHKGERVITAADNRRYWPVLSAIHNGTIEPDVLNDFAKGYLRDGTAPNAMAQLSPNIVFVSTGTDSSGVERRLERIENVLADLPKYMPRTTINGNMGGLLNVVEKRQARARFNDKIAK